MILSTHSSTSSAASAPNDLRRILGGPRHHSRQFEHGSAVGRLPHHRAEVRNDAGHPEALIHQFVDQVGTRVFVRGHLPEHLGKGGDPGQGRVDLVREPGRQSPEAGEPLLVTNSILEVSKFGHILQNHDPAVEAPTVELEDRHRENDMPLRIGQGRWPRC